MAKYLGECLAKLIRFQSRIRSSSIIYGISIHDTMYACPNFYFSVCYNNDPVKASLTLGACARGMVVILCVCICLLPLNLLHTSFIRRKQGVIEFFKMFQAFCHVAFAENALFKTFGMICRSPPPSLLPNDLSMDKRDSNNFFSTQRVCMSSGSPHNTTNSTLIRAN